MLVLSPVERVIAALLVAAVMLVAAAWPAAEPPPAGVSQVSAVTTAPAPTATYVSELGPASMRGPNGADELPVAGSTAPDEATHWREIAGGALALGGAGFLLLALRLRLNAGT